MKASFHPERILLVVDDGWSSREIEKIKQLFAADAAPVDIRYASVPRGLVHAKIYLAQWTSNDVDVSRQLLWGSANASAQGFDVHAETLASATVSFETLPRLEQYFSQLKKPDGSVEQIEVDTGGVRLVLPGFSFKSTPEPETFDAWLQQGCLCHEYLPSSTFGSILIRLKKRPPPGSTTAAIERNLGKISSSIDFRSRYIKFGDVRSRTTWRAKYFVDSWLGHWTSAECYEARGSMFMKSGTPDRRYAAKYVAESKKGDRRTWFNDLMKKVKETKNELEAKGKDPSEYFHISSGKVDRTAYHRGIIEQLRRQKKQASRAEFRERFALGYYFARVPPFRGAGASEYSFGDFVESWCESLITEWAKGTKQNRLAQTVHDALSKRGIDLDKADGAALLRALRDEWPHVGSEIRRFHAE